jgi:hypothetical protein
MRTQIRNAIVVVALASSIACNADTAFGPGSRSDLDQVIIELETMKKMFAVSWSRPTDFPLSRIVPANCPYVPSTQSFTCPSVAMGSVTVWQSYVPLSASGAPQTVFDVARTAAVRMTTTFSGTSPGNTELAVDGRETLTLSGLLSGKHTFDGTSSYHYNGTHITYNTFGGGTTRTLINTTVVTTVSQLVMPPDVVVDGFPNRPVSGTIAVTNSASVSGQPPMLSSAVFPFDGTTTVVAVITVNGVSRTCPVALVGMSYSLCL